MMTQIKFCNDDYIFLFYGLSFLCLIFKIWYSFWLHFCVYVIQFWIDSWFWVYAVDMCVCILDAETMTWNRKTIVDIFFWKLPTCNLWRTFLSEVSISQKLMTNFFPVISKWYNKILIVLNQLLMKVSPC